MIKVFGLHGMKDYAKQIADYLDIKLCDHIEKYFPGKEAYIKSDENVRGCDVFIICSLYSDIDESVNDKLMKLVIFIGSLFDASANRITLVAPYLCYQRQDRKLQSRAPITTKYLAEMLEAVGCNRILTMDPHSITAYQGGFRIPNDTIGSKNLIVDYLANDTKIQNGDMVVLNPDRGGLERSDAFRKTLEKRLAKKVPLVHFDKIRRGTEIEGNTSIDVKGKLVVVFDDLISSGSTLAKCEEVCTASGGEFYAACATHGLFVDNAEKTLAKINKVVVTDTIRAAVSPDLQQKLVVISTAKMFAQAIKRIHFNGSISELLT